LSDQLARKTLVRLRNRFWQDRLNELVDLLLRQRVARS
jgi:hypothetical protein